MRLSFLEKANTANKNKSKDRLKNEINNIDYFFQR